MEVGEPMKSKAPGGETFPGSLITVVSAVSGTEENMKKTTITDSTSNTTLIINPPSSKVVESVQVQTHNPRPLNTCIPESEQDKAERPGSCYISTSTSTSPQPPLCSSERSSASEFPSFNLNAERQSLTTLTDGNEESSKQWPDSIAPWLRRLRHTLIPYSIIQLPSSDGASCTIYRLHWDHHPRFLTPNLLSLKNNAHPPFTMCLIALALPQ